MNAASLFIALGYTIDKASQAAAEGNINKITSLAKKASLALKTMGVVSVFKDMLHAGGELQQSIGGIETLFEDASDIMIERANKAYKTAGMSANSYMQQVTSFAASLKQSTDDIYEAADVADRAMVSISDNVNKMGTPMENVASAYQAFAKQNYTLLDNLKLGGHGLAQYKPRENGETLAA